MHSAVALRTMWTCVSLPSPASLPETVSVLPLRVALADTKCGLPANATWLPANMKRATRTAVASTSLTGFIMFDLLGLHVRFFSLPRRGCAGAHPALVAADQCVASGGADGS